MDNGGGRSFVRGVEAWKGKENFCLSTVSEPSHARCASMVQVGIAVTRECFLGNKIA